MTTFSDIRGRVKEPDAFPTKRQAYRLLFELCRRYDLPPTRAAVAALIAWLRAGGEGEPPRAEGVER